MDIRFVPRAEIDKTKWNSCVHYAPNGNAFGYMWYLDAMARHWDALVEGDYESVLPLAHRQHWWRGPELYQPELVRELGIYSINALSAKRVNAFWEAIPTEYRRFNLHVNGQSRPTQLPNARVNEQRNLVLPLLDAYELLAERFETPLLENLRVARAANLTANANLKPEAIAALYRTYDRSRAAEARFHGLQRIMYQALHRGWGFASGIQNEQGELLAADFFLLTHNRILSLAPTQTAAGASVHALAYLYHFLLHTQAGKAVLLDFNVRDEPTAQLARAFGALPETYWQVQR